MFDKRLLWTGVALAVVTALSVTLSRIPEKDDSLIIHEPVSDVLIPPEEESASAPEAEYAWLLKEHEGRIAVFAWDKDTPEMVLDVSVRFLPDYDRILLKEGIPVKDSETLFSMIEDYIS